MHAGRAVARAGGTQAWASVLRIKRDVIALGSAWTVFRRLSSGLYAICSRAVAGPVQPHPRLTWWSMHAGRAVARAAGTQTWASLLRIRRDDIALGLAWTVSGRLSSDLYAICSHAVVGPVQPHPHRAWWLMHSLYQIRKFVPRPWFADQRSGISVLNFPGLTSQRNQNVYPTESEVVFIPQ